jgi:glycosyltransferase involved in cell wall biosynthesis
MKIQFDHQIFSLQQYGGISRFFSVLQDHLRRSKDFGMDPGLLVSRNHYLSPGSFSIPAGMGRALVSRSRTYAFNRRYCKYLVEKNQFDVFHPTYYDAYFLPRLKKPFVLTVHDMTHELFPEFFPQDDPFITYKREIIEKADHLIAISEATKNDLLEIFGVPERKVSIIHHGLYPIEGLAEAVPDLPKRFLLYVGARNGYKNFRRLMKAFAMLLEEDKELEVICAGGGAFNLAERELLHRTKLTAAVRQIQVSDHQLKTLYQNASLFVYPSLCEGFGLPILEAFHNECPVAASDTSCFPEVGGDAVVYFDPYSPEDIARALKAVIYNGEVKDVLLEKGQQRLARFPLEDCMKKTMVVYKSLAQ